MNDTPQRPRGTSSLARGAVGGTIGGCLFQAGHDVVLVARGAHLDALRADGLRLAVCAQNGVANEGIALRRFRCVYGMCVWLPATHLQPGVVEAQGVPCAGLLPVGRYPSGPDAFTQRFSAALVASRFLAPASDDIMRWKYGKLLANLANALEAL
jgi:2-dehydropantoate 2-reductase